MNLSEPYDLVLTRATAAVMRVLIGAETSFSIRQIARIAEITVPQAARVIEYESARGLVLVDIAGRSKMCRFNNEHIGANSVVELLTLRERMIQLMSSEISLWAIQPLHSSLFGSAARGSGDTESDLDVLLVRPEEAPTAEWEQQKYLSATLLRRKIGNSISWFDISLSELSTARLVDEPIFSEWKRDGVALTEVTLPNLLKDTIIDSVR